MYSLTPLVPTYTMFMHARLYQAMNICEANEITVSDHLTSFV